MSNVLGELFGDIADAIREKTGDTATMKPAEFPSKISTIEVGGGSSADVRYVTFMSDDGTVEFGKLPVAVGYDCPNPKFAVTKESTAQYHYDLAGWATTPNGAMDANALKEVNEDRTVYANFAAILRYYTITYLDTDGSVLKTESLAYGAMPSYAPTKQGFNFDGWTPTPVAVDGNASYTATWAELPMFATATWEEIVSIAQSGNAASAFSLGDERTETITYADGTSEEITWRIVALDNAIPCEDGSKDNIVIGAKHALSQKRQLKNSSSVDYKTSDLANYLNNDFYSALPDDLKSGIKAAYVTGGGYEKVWISTAANLSIGSAYGQRAFEYYDSNSKRIATLGANGEATKYWTATTNNQGALSYVTVIGTEGQVISDGALPRDVHGVVPFFCI